MNYYFLVAGLTEVEIEDNKMTYSVAEFKQEVHPQLSAGDAKLMELFYTKFDNQNLLRYFKDKEALFDERGNVTKEELEEAIELIIEEETPKNRNIPPYFKVFIEEFRSGENHNIEDVKWENRLAELYYQWAMNNKNKLIRRWYEFNMNLNNILAAYASRKHHLEVDVVGDNEVTEALKTSRQRDFGLTVTLDDFDKIQRLADEIDFFEREKKIDVLKWQWLEEQTFFEYFSIERIFAYLVKLEIIERWVSLNPEQGGKIFREMINALKEYVVNQKSLVLDKVQAKTEK